MAKLINGNGNRAIYAAQDADLIASLAGNVTCIANVGNKYAATIEDANTIGLADGVIITKEGRRIQLDAGNVDLFTIPTGSSGVTNYYIIGYKLVQQADSSQVAETFVQKMNSSSATIAEGTLRGGDNEVFVSVYRVIQVDFTIDSVSGLLPELLDSAAVKDDIAQINSDLSSSTAKAINFTNGYANIIDAFAYERSGLTIVDKIQVQVNTAIPTSSSQVLVTLDVAPSVEMRCAFIAASGVTFLGKLSTTGALVLDNYSGNAIPVNTNLYVIGNMIID